MSTTYQEGSGATRAPPAAPATAAALPMDVILGALAESVTAQDSPGHIIYANEAAAHAAGYASAEAMLAAPPADLLRRFEILDESLQPFPPDALPDRLALQGIPSTGTTMCWRDRLTGQQRWSVVSARPVFGPDGEVQMAVNISRDITEQVEQRRALEHAATQPRETIDRLQHRTREAESERERTATVLESFGDAFFVLDSSWRLAYTNPTAEKLLRDGNHNSGSLLGKQLWDDFPEFRGTPLDEQLQQTLRHRQASGAEFQHPRTARWYEAHTFASAEGVSALVRDVTARKQAEAELRESEGRFRTLADTAPVLIWMRGPDTRCNFVNKPWLVFTGRTLEQELAGGWEGGIHPDDLQRCRDTYRTACEEREPFRMEYRRCRYDGEYRWVLDHGVPRFAPDGSFAGYIGSCADIHQRVEDQHALERNAAQLAELTQELDRTVGELKARTQEAEMSRAAAETTSSAKTNFLGVMSHELRTPLNAIIGFAELVRDGVSGPVTPVQVEQLDRIVVGARRLLQLVEEILSFARLENAEEPLSLGSVDLGVLTREAANLIQPLASERGIELTVDGDAEPITTDQARLRQILLNLLSNAVKFTDSGEVRLEAHRLDDEVIVRVTDTGTGIPPEHQARIFDPFWQADQSSTRAHEGIGLGLAATRQLVELLGGTVEVESTPGEGSTFTIRLPA